MALYDGVIPNACKDLSKLLLSSIFKLIPSTQRLFFHTRISNKAGINQHCNFGFSKISGPLPYWIDLEYTIEKSSILQNASKILVGDL